MESEIQVGSKIKVADEDSEWYCWHGVVTKKIVQTSFPGFGSEDFSYICSLRRGNAPEVQVEMKPFEIESEM